MEHILRETKRVAGLEGRSGDPSPFTARGVLRAIQAAAKRRWGSDSLSGRCVAVQGCGHVGFVLADLLRRAGARVLCADVDPERVGRVVSETGAEAIDPAAIYDVPADIFAPCALGGIIDDDTVPRFKVEIIAGAANNQLGDDRHGALLSERGILYAPDFVANAGGIISATPDLLGWDPSKASAHIDGIYDSMLANFDIAARDHVSTDVAATRLAETRLRAKG